MTSSSDQTRYERELQDLHKAWIALDDRQQSPQAVADAVVELILAGHRQLAGAADNPRLSSLVDQRTIARMRQWDSNDPAMSTLEKVFRRLAEGRGVDAIQLIEAAFKAKEEALSISQSTKAKYPRLSHPVSLLIRDIVVAEPTITEHLLLLKLKRMAGGDVVHVVTETEIVPTDPAFSHLKVDGLKDRLSRIKQKLSR